MATKKTFSEFIQEARHKAGLSQSDVAHHFGYETPQFISNWERGVSHPPVKDLKSLGKLYKVSAEEMYELLEAEVVADLSLSLTKRFKRA